MKGIKLFLLLTFFCSKIAATTYYVAPSGGSDGNPGTISSPWSTWAHAFSTARAGDIVYFRGGVWYPTDRILITNENANSGIASNYINYFAYPGEVPILDCINKTVHGEGLFISGVNYIHLKGLTIRNNKETTNDDLDASGFGFQFNVGLIVENCTSYGNGCRGFYFAEVASATILNCDSYNNISERSTGTFRGNHGEGLIFTGTTTGKPFNGNVTVTGCRAWGNSDSGFGSNCGGVETWINNWSFDNGRLAGEGCGFKYLPAAWLGTGVLSRIMHNNIAAHNGYGTTNHGGNAGFTENGASFDLPNLTFDNNFSYGNYSDGYSTYGGLNGARAVRLMRNNVSYKDPTTHVWISGNPPTDTYNSWNNPPDLTLSDADFQSVDYTQLSRPRKADGSLPDITFGKLAAGSRLINVGVDVGLPFDGDNPDLGYSEYQTTITPGYVNSSIENAAPTIIDIIFSQNLSGIVPAGSSFVVKVNSTDRSIGTISIIGTKVSLTLSSQIIYGDAVTISYTKPLTNPLQNSTGDQVVSFSNRPVANRINPPHTTSPEYISSTVENDNPSMIEMSFDHSLANIIPVNTSFVVMVNSGAREVTGVVVFGTKVQLMLSSPVFFGDLITIAYNVPAVNPLQTPSGGLAAIIGAQIVVNKVESNDQEKGIIIYPNPANENITIHLDKKTPDPDFFKIVDLSGKVLFNAKVSLNNMEFTTTFNLNSGIYIIQVGSDKKIVFTQKLIVLK